MLEPERLHLAIWRRVACWISKATRAQHTSAPVHTHTHTHTHTQICNIYYFSTVTIVSWTRLNVTLYIHHLSSPCKKTQIISRFWLSRYSDSLQAGRTGDRIPVWAKFSVPIQTGSENHPASCTIETGSFPGVKRPGRGVNHPPPSSVEVKEKVELYPYSP
jgi:hypothetical protein